MRTFLLSTVLILYALISIFSLVLSGNFLLDLFISLMPYWLIVNGSLLLTLFFRLVHTKRFSLLLRPYFALSLILLMGATGLMLTHFVGFTFLQVIPGTGTTPLKVAFLNKLYSNTDYAAITTVVNQVHPDVIGFSEIKPGDIKQITALKTYPYMFVKMTRNDAAIAFFSKYPCSEQKNLFVHNYILPLQVHVTGKTYQMFVVHPLPPGNTTWIAMRDTELSLLARYIHHHANSQVLVLGDFNTSTWSPVASAFAKETQLVDTAQGRGIHFTWHSPLIQTQIDHIYVPSHSVITQFSSVGVPGSDHNLIWAQVDI